MILMILLLKHERDQQEAPLTMTETMPFLPGLSPVSGKKIAATFDGETLWSNGGVLILREIEERLGLSACRAASCSTSMTPTMLCT
jgi:hypothetical protein